MILFFLISFKEGLRLIATPFRKPVQNFILWFPEWCSNQSQTFMEIKEEQQKHETKS